MDLAFHQLRHGDVHLVVGAGTLALVHHRLREGLDAVLADPEGRFQPVLVHVLAQHAHDVGAVGPPLPLAVRHHLQPLGGPMGELARLRLIDLATLWWRRRYENGNGLMTHETNDHHIT